MPRENNSRKSNGHAGPHDRDNFTAGRIAAGGHAPASTARGGVQAHLDHAASDDASGVPVANAAAFPAAANLHVQASTDREACAEVAPPPPNGAAHQRAGKKTKPSKAGKKSPDSGGLIEIPPGTEPLPADGGGFVDAMHKHLDLYLACARLVKSKDEKIAQRAVERLLEMKYGKGPSQTEDSSPIIFDLPRPEREHP